MKNKNNTDSQNKEIVIENNITDNETIKKKQLDEEMIRKRFQRIKGMF